DPNASTDSFCKAGPDGVAYDGEKVVPDPDVVALITDERTRLAPIAGRTLGHADADVTRDRINESPLANALTDELLPLSKGADGGPPDVAMVNTGGIRDNIRAGAVTYESMFSVLPFNNHAVVVGPMDGARLMGVLTRSIQSCGSYGSVMQSGLVVRFERDCNR